jgi:thiol-disulfide isomerase/thioredoxin
MNMKKLIFIGITVTLIMASLTTGCLNGDDKDKEEELPNLGAAPNFTLTSIDNDTFSLNDFEGKIVILDFMATWCGPCKQEMGHLKDVYNNYGKSQVQIISIDIDETETDEMLRDFAETWGDDWLYAIDTEGDVEDDYLSPGDGIPYEYIIDQNGDIRYKHEGKHENYEALAELIDKLI